MRCALPFTLNRAIRSFLSEDIRQLILLKEMYKRFFMMCCSAPFSSIPLPQHTQEKRRAWYVYRVDSRYHSFSTMPWIMNLLFLLPKILFMRASNVHQLSSMSSNLSAPISSVSFLYFSYTSGE